MARETRAVELFSGGLACSQAVLAVFCDAYGLDKTMALRVSTGFRGGMKSAEVCGAVSGAVMVIGLKYGHVAAEDIESKNLAGMKVEAFMRAFRERHGFLTCRDLLGCDITTKEGRQTAVDRNLFRVKCVELIRDAVRILEASGY